MSASLQCPFCDSTGWTDETDRLAHVLDAHSQRLFMASAVLREFRVRNVSWDTYWKWLEGAREVSPRLGR